MRWRLRASRSRPALTVNFDVFDTAATELGFTLDDAQRRAGAALATDRNLYLWGPVGRGKSWLMATYFAALPTDRKVRVHFHEFFRDLHLAIRRHRNDLAAALDDLLGGVDVVCFDEFHVHDPADGKFIARLLPALLDRDIRIILTSNYPPHTLLPNPLFHTDFVPTIELIEQALTVVTVDGPADYRTISGHEAVRRGVVDHPGRGRPAGAAGTGARRTSDPRSRRASHPRPPGDRRMPVARFRRSVREDHRAGRLPRARRRFPAVDDRQHSRSPHRGP